ncbi:YtxH domain-containing protein [candidate division WWE3 bacterium]|nr:YtxH domain-containing protein [candidate division WWE3 bacterium]
MSESKSKSFLVGAILGVAVGSVTGLLLAPKKGQDTRKILKKRFETYGNKVNKSIQELSDKGVTLPEEAIKMGKNLLDAAENKLEQVVSAVEQAGGDIESQSKPTQELPIEPSQSISEGDTNNTQQDQTPRKKRFFKGI